MTYRKDLLADGITVSMLIDSFDHDVSDVFSLLNDSIQILVVSAANSQTLAGISDDLLIIYYSDDLDHLFQEIASLQGKNDTLVLSEATREASDQILDKRLRLLLDAQPV